MSNIMYYETSSNNNNIIISYHIVGLLNDVGIGWAAKIFPSIEHHRANNMDSCRNHVLEHAQRGLLFKTRADVTSRFLLISHTFERDWRRPLATESNRPSSKTNDKTGDRRGG